MHDLPSPPLDPPELLSKEERKRREKEEKERKKKEKEEQKRKKKEEEKEKKRLAKEKKKKPAVEEKWQEAVAVSATSETIVTMDRAPRRMSSFEEQKDDKVSELLCYFFFGHILFFVVDNSWFFVLRSSMSRYCPGLVVHGPMENCAVYTCIIYSVTCTVYFRHALNITICCSCLWFIIVIVTYKISDFEKK